jgi:hypothetical protein
LVRVDNREIRAEIPFEIQEASDIVPSPTPRSEFPAILESEEDLAMNPE